MQHLARFPPPPAAAAAAAATTTIVTTAISVIREFPRIGEDSFELPIPCPSRLVIVHWANVDNRYCVVATMKNYDPLPNVSLNR